MASNEFKTYLWGDYARASNAGWMHIQFGRWIIQSGWQTWRPILFMVIWLDLSLYFPWVFVPFFIVSLGGLIMYFLYLHDLFIAGDVLPGMVINERAGLVAAGTNATRLFGSYPVIAVIKTSLPAKYRKNRTKIPVIASYGAEEEKGAYWDRLAMYVVANGVGDPVIIEQKINSVPNQQWQDFQRQISQIPVPLKPGLYKVDVESSGWRNHPDAVLRQSLAFQYNTAFCMEVIYWAARLFRMVVPYREK